MTPLKGEVCSACSYSFCLQEVFYLSRYICSFLLRGENPNNSESISVFKKKTHLGIITKFRNIRVSLHHCTKQPFKRHKLGLKMKDNLYYKIFRILFEHLTCSRENPLSDVHYCAKGLGTLTKLMLKDIFVYFMASALLSQYISIMFPNITFPAFM